MTMTSYSRQTYHLISYVHIYTHTLQNKVIYIPVKNKIKKTDSRKLEMIYGVRWLLQ